jgi:hypothetical protein
MSDYGPEFDAYADRVRREVLPMIQDSHVVCSIVPASNDKLDIKFAVELGMSVMLDKPILAVVAPGAPVSKKLRLVVDRFLVLDLNDPASIARLAEAVKKMAEEKAAMGSPL